MDVDVIQCVTSLEVDGVITPDAVLKEAAKKKSPLYSYFEWDDSKAAYNYRLDQARALIRSVRVVVTEESHQISTIAYVRNPEAGTKQQGYISTQYVKESKSKSRRALMIELQRAEYALQRAYEVAEALGLSAEVEALLAQVRGIRSAA